MIIFTDFVEMHDCQDIAGYMLIGVVVINFMINICVIGTEMIKKLKMIWKNRRLYWTKFK